MNDLTKKYDNWFESTGPAALVIREHLIPVEGADGVLFPATFAPSEDKKTFEGGYNIDAFSDGTNVCLIDSVGSQANRIEPLFMAKEYAGLVPQIVVKAGTKSVNLLEAGHRAGDAIIRCSTLQQEFHTAFKALQNGNAEPLATIAPTSLVFGAWDSRDTQAKLPRLIDSKIRAFNVRKLTRSASYVVQQHIDYVKEGLLAEPLSDAEKKLLSTRGYLNALASATHGGVIATGGIRRDASFHLAALRLLTASSAEKTLALRRYVLGLSLTALTAPPAGYLRQGCNLVLDPDQPTEFKVVFNNGRREDAAITHEDALLYAKAAAKEYGIDTERQIDFKSGPDKEVLFDKELAKKDVNDAIKKKSK